MKNINIFCFLIVDNNDLIFKVQNFKFEYIENYAVYFNMNEFFETICKNINKIKNKYEWIRFKKGS